MPFILPMLATRLEDPRRLADPRFSAEPKHDGQRAQLHIRDHRTVHAFSRPRRELIRLPGLAWLREIRYTAQRAGGWETQVMVQRYAHLSPDHIKAAVERLAVSNSGRATGHWRRTW